MERLNRDCDDQRQAIVNAESTIQGAQQNFASLGQILVLRGGFGSK